MRRDEDLVAGITWWSFYFRVYPSTIRAPQVVDFLDQIEQNSECPPLTRISDLSTTGRGSRGCDCVSPATGFHAIPIEKRLNGARHG